MTYKASLILVVGVGALSLGLGYRVYHDALDAVEAQAAHDRQHAAVRAQLIAVISGLEDQETLFAANALDGQGKALRVKHALAQLDLDEFDTTENAPPEQLAAIHREFDHRREAVKLDTP